MISNKDINDLATYFEDIKAERELTEKELYFLEICKLYSDTFVVSCVTKDDLECEGFDTTDVTDETMKRIANKMGNAYCDNGYWDDLKFIAEICDVPKKQK